MNHEEKLDKILNDISDIKRGLYGDEMNKLPGLIDRQIKDESRIEAIEKREEKRNWWFAGFAAAISLVASFVWHFIKEIFTR